jgi:hypothetical protein
MELVVMPQDHVIVCQDIVEIDANEHVNMELLEQIVKINANVKMEQLVIQFQGIANVALAGEEENAIDHV